MSFLSEIKRRNVVRVALAYAATSWLLIQIVVSIEEPLSLPTSFDTVVIVLLAIGFPVALLLAWAYELTPNGLRPTDSVAPESSITTQTGRRLTSITIAILTLAVVVLLAERFIISPAPAPIANSIAVMPFENRSPNESDAFFAPSLHDEVLNQLEKIQNLAVIGEATMSRYEDSELTLAEIADELNVEALLTASVSFAEDAVAINAQLIDPREDERLWSDALVYPFENVFALRSEIAMYVANALVVEFSADEQRLIAEQSTASPEAYVLYLEANHLADMTRADLSRRDPVVLALEKFKQATDIDPEFVDAWVAMANANYIGGMAHFPDNAEFRTAEASALDTALALDPDHPVALVTLARRLYINGNRFGAYREYLRARELAGRPINPEIPQALGYMQESLDDINLAMELDPINLSSIRFSMRANDSLGNEREVRDLFRRAVDLFDTPIDGAAYLSFLLANADASEVETFIEQAADDRLKDLLDQHDDLDAALQAYIEGGPQAASQNETLASMFAAYLGHPEQAWNLYFLPQSTIISRVWSPLYKDVRQLPEFKAFLVESGFVDVWREHGFPEEFCEPLDEEDFVCH